MVHRKAALAVDLLGLAVIFAFLCSFLSWLVFFPHPATGGDMGSHYWTLQTLVQGGPDLRVRNWNPGNFAGEPQLLHYFPVPFLTMAFLSFLLPLAVAFNIGTVLPLVLFPVCVYYAIVRLEKGFPVPIVCALSSAFFLLNESYTMWGGNGLSLLAGQFSHAYALCFLLLFIGSNQKEYEKKSLPLKGALFASFAWGSHPYVALGVHFFQLSFVLSSERRTLLSRFRYTLVSLLLTGLLSVWVVWPMAENALWTTPVKMIWYSDNFWSEIIPIVMYPVLIVGFISLVLETVKHVRVNSVYSLYRQVVFWGVPCVCYGICYFVFPYFGLVDVRAVPQIILCTLLFFAICFGRVIQRARYKATLFATVLSFVLILLWVGGQVRYLPQWVEWNYGSWISKPGYADFSKITTGLAGDFSMPRVVFEHHGDNLDVGTPRAFEMLPYFSGRATLEGVYSQSSILAPATYFIQALVSNSASCPLGSEFACPKWDLKKAEKYLRLMGVRDLILRSPELKQEAANHSSFGLNLSEGPWDVYSLKEAVSYVETPDEVKLLLSGVDWKEAFYAWLLQYEPSAVYLVAASSLPKVKSAQDGDCKTSVRVAINRIHLTTNCPGIFHVLKFAYHPAWRASGGQTLSLTSPGFIGLVPEQSEVNLRFEPRTSWFVTGMTSFATILLVLLGIFKRTVTIVSRNSVDAEEDYKKKDA